MKKILSLMIVLMLICSTSLSVSAEDGNVTYSGDSGKFIFEPGSSYSPTDLFPNFKGVMPGDSISQNIIVKNDASNQVEVRLYMRALGAHEDSRDFLSRLNLRVIKLTDTELFDAAADQSAQLIDWTYLGTLYSGGEVELEVILDVPVTLDNQYCGKVGYLDWEFMAEEFPIENDESEETETSTSADGTTLTGDNANIVLYAGTLVCSGVVLLWTFLMGHKKAIK